MVQIPLYLPYPLSVNRYWRHTPKGTFISVDGLQFKMAVHAEYLYRIKPIGNDIALTVIIHPKLTAKGESSKILIDLDNGLKSILDSLIGIVYHDDKQVKQINIGYGKPMQKGATTVSWKLNIDQLNHQEVTFLKPIKI